MGYILEVKKLTAPALVIHGGAGSYTRTLPASARAERGQTMLSIVEKAHLVLQNDGARKAVLSAIADLEKDPRFNAGYGSRLQADGRGRLSASLMDGLKMRLSAVYGVEDCLHPSLLADALQSRGDRNLDGTGAKFLMRDLGMPLADIRSPEALARWRELVATGETADPESAIGSAGRSELLAAREAQLPVPSDLSPLKPAVDRSGTVGAVALDPTGALWACTSTGGRGHEAVGRISDSPTPAGNYACPVVALSATGFGEQILDLNLCGRIATRMLDGMSLESALRRTFQEADAAGALLGVIAISHDGIAAYAHTTEACSVAWADAEGRFFLDPHSRA